MERKREVSPVDIADGIFREYDIRGVYGRDLTEEVAELLGRAFALYLGKRGLAGPGLTVSVGRDVRTSSGAIRDALVRGLVDSGVDCVDIGVCPTPLQYFSMHRLGADGGIMITGSHNPPEYNGFKISVGRDTIHGPEIQALKDLVAGLAGGPTPPPPPAGRRGSLEHRAIIPDYLDYVAGGITLPELSRPIKVVLDAGNGTAGPVAPALMRRLGCDVVELFCAADGGFPNHHPDPTVPANLADLIEAVRGEGADFGVAYDGDADRIGVVDEGGEIIWGDRLMIIYARDILETTPGAVVVGEVKSSQVMYDEIAHAGGRPVMWKTGHSLIKSKMRELGAAMAGEMSGHIFFADRYFGFDDAIYATARLVEILAARRMADPAFGFSSLLAGVPSTHATPEIRIDCPDGEKFAVVERLRDAIGAGDTGFSVSDVITLDGVRINFDGGWALLRASNTQPVLVLRFEAESAHLLERAREFVRGLLDRVRPGLWVGF
ncbi:MAG: phosphomannomutase/phosphoglucomutase [Thermodesulfobacteriota bacterium]